MKTYSVCIAGGGSTYTPDMMELLCMLQGAFPVHRVVLYDIDAERQDIVGRYGEVLFREYMPGVEFAYTTDKDEALTGIDFAFVQIRAGGLGLRESDEKIPYRLGVIGQETCGPGGLAYGIRSVPAMIELVHDIRARSKEAWIINYSNPAAIVAEATKRVFPDDRRLINICDMPTSVLDMYLPLIGKKRADIQPLYFGLNHFGWFTQILDRKSGEDLLPGLLKRIVDDYESLSTRFDAGISGPDDHWAITFRDHLDMVHDFPYSLPNTYNLYYLYPERTRAHYSVEHTRFDEVVAGRERIVFHYCREVAEAGRMKGTEHDITERIGKTLSAMQDTRNATIYADNDVHAAYLVELVLSIVSNAMEIGLVMTENTGICPNLDAGMMLEVPCLMGAEGVLPLNMGPVPAFEKGLLENQYACEKLLVDAIFEGSERKLLQAFAENRIVRDVDMAKQLIAAFKEANGSYWPAFK